MQIVFCDFLTFSCNWNTLGPGFLQSSHSVVEELLFLVFQPAICSADNVLVVRNFVSFHEFLQFRKTTEVTWSQDNVPDHTSAQSLAAIRNAGMNYSVTNRIRHSYSYYTANGWLEDQEQQFFYNGIRASVKCWTRCILVAEEYVKKSQNTICISPG